MSAGTEQLSCQEVVELVTSYLEGALDPVDAQRFEQHLTRCDGCDGYVEQMRATIRLTGSVRLSDLGADAERTLVAAFRDWAGA
jgi:anti-sigma factor RsiW